MASTNRQKNSRQIGRNRVNAYGYYEGGTAARKLAVDRELERAPRRADNSGARRNREKARHMNFGYVLFLTVALVLVGMTLINYVGLQSDITNSVKNISVLESKLNNMRLENDEEYIRISSSVDLEEVKRIAIQELGMQYAEEGQIVTFASESKDYVKQMAEIPQ